MRSPWPVVPLNFPTQSPSGIRAAKKGLTTQTVCSASTRLSKESLTITRDLSRTTSNPSKWSLRSSCATAPAPVPTGTGNYIWNNSSFIYLPNSTAGSNQSHYFQHLKSATTDINFQPDRKWRFDTYQSAIKLKNGVFPTAANQAQDFAIEVDGAAIVQSVCSPNGTIIFSIFNPVGLNPRLNALSGPGQYNSTAICGPTRKFSFAFPTATITGRNNAMNFLNNIVPDGYYVVAMSLTNSNTALNTYASTWQADEITNGSGISLYHTLKNAGFVDIDSFNRPRAFNFIYKKVDNSFVPVRTFSIGLTDKIVTDVLCPVTKSSGTITSPVFGPAKVWNQFHWRGAPLETTPGDSISFNIIGVSAAGTETILYTIDSTTKDFNISSIDAKQFPYLKLKMFNRDTAKGSITKKHIN